MYSATDTLLEVPPAFSRQQKYLHQHLEPLAGAVGARGRFSSPQWGEVSSRLRSSIPLPGGGRHPPPRPAARGDPRHEVLVAMNRGEARRSGKGTPLCRPSAVRRTFIATKGVLISFIMLLLIV